MSLIQSFHKAGLAGVVALAMNGAAVASVSVGVPAPDFEVAGDSGKPVKLSDFKGRYVVLEWTNEGCPFVQKHYKSGNMQRLQKTYTDKNVAWLTVFSSADGKQGHVDAAGARKFQADYRSASSAMLLDGAGTVGKLYGAKTTPHMFIVDPRGSLIYMGGIDDEPSANVDDIARSTNYVQLALDESMAGKPLSTPTSKPYGCSIKY